MRYRGEAAPADAVQLEAAAAQLLGRGTRLPDLDPGDFAQARQRVAARLAEPGPSGLRSLGAVGAVGRFAPWGSGRGRRALQERDEAAAARMLSRASWVPDLDGFNLARSGRHVEARMARIDAAAPAGGPIRWLAGAPARALAALGALAVWKRPQRPRRLAPIDTAPPPPTWIGSAASNVFDLDRAREAVAARLAEAEAAARERSLGYRLRRVSAAAAAAVAAVGLGSILFALTTTQKAAAAGVGAASQIGTGTVALAAAHKVAAGAVAASLVVGGGAAADIGPPLLTGIEVQKVRDLAQTQIQQISDLWSSEDDPFVGQAVRGTGASPRTVETPGEAIADGAAVSAAPVQGEDGDGATPAGSAGETGGSTPSAGGAPSGDTGDGAEGVVTSVPADEEGATEPDSATSEDTGGRPQSLYAGAAVTCENGAVDTTGPSFGRAVITANSKGDLNIEVSISDAAPDTTYDLWIVQHPGGCTLGEPTVPAALATGGNGHGSVQVKVPRLPDAEQFWVAVVGGSQVFYSTAETID